MADTKPKRLGRGLASLIQSPVPVEPVPRETSSPLRSIAVDRIAPNRFQPRTAFDPAGISSLAESVRRSGVMQPIIVRPVGEGRFEIVAGERRWRAAQEAGLAEIPALVRELADQDSAEWALVENVQRTDLNPIERGTAFKLLQERFGLSHAEIGERVGLERSSVANFIRLTELEPAIQASVIAEELSAGHARALLGVPAGETRLGLASEAVRSGWNVRQLEERCRAVARAEPVAVGEERPERAADAALRDLEKRLSHYLGTKVALRTNPTGARGKIQIEFYGLDHFDGLMDQIGFTQANI